MIPIRSSLPDSTRHVDSRKVPLSGLWTVEDPTRRSQIMVRIRRKDGAGAVHRLMGQEASRCGWATQWSLSVADIAYVDHGPVCGPGRRRPGV